MFGAHSRLMKRVEMAYLIGFSVLLALSLAVGRNVVLNTSGQSGYQPKIDISAGIWPGTLKLTEEGCGFLTTPHEKAQTSTATNSEIPTQSLLDLPALAAPHERGVEGLRGSLFADCEIDPTS